MVMGACDLALNNFAALSQTGVGTSTKSEAIEMKGNNPTFRLNRKPISRVIKQNAASPRAQWLNHGDSAMIGPKSSSHQT
jgi:hypothetical protein